ncbi:MAG: HlyD family efflux transporter periplasmic adaptor subunit [Luteitalea sp.]|nr:HlyD family efflux transporter periplasmic adaptor subunit [Luteitalea sp.]
MSPRRRQRLVWLLAGTAGLVVVASAVTAGLGKLRSRSTEIPFAPAERSSLDQTVHLKGELRTTKSTMIQAPPVPGTMRILSLLPTGTAVQKGDLVLSFDTADQEYQLGQAQSQLREAEYEIDKLEADNAVQAAKDEVDLLSARYDVRAAELDIRGNELVGKVEARKNELTLEEAGRKLEELERNVRERSTTSRAALDVAREKRNKALIAIKEAERNIAQMTIVAPFDGVLSVLANRDAAGGIFYPGIVLPEYAEGDMASPGRPIAELLDVTQLEVLAKAPESVGATLAPKQRAKVSIDSRGGRAYRAHVKTVGAVASRGKWWNAGTAREFDVTLELEGEHTALKPGQTLRVEVAAAPLEDVVHVPRQAVFDQRGASVVYVRNARGFEAHEVKVVRRTETRAVLEGLEEGLEVALVNPEEAPASRNSPTPSTPTAPLGT